LSKHNNLQRHYRQLKDELAKLKPPPGLEDLAVENEPEAPLSIPAAHQGETSTATDIPAPTTPLLTDMHFTPSNTSTPLSAPSTPPTPTISDGTPDAHSQATSNDTAEATSEPLTSYDPKLVQHV
jgi:hypothetical protein